MTTSTTTAVIYRPFAGLDDLPGMLRANGAHRLHVGSLERLELSAMEHYYRHLPHTDLTRDVLIAEVDGRIVGYGRAAWSDKLDGSRTYESTVLVDPSVWGQGIGASLLAWVEARTRELAVESPARAGAGPIWAGTQATDGDAEMQPAIEAAGYRIVRRAAEMLRDDLDDPLPEHPLAEGFEIRPLPVGRERAFYDLTVEAFADSFDEPLATDEAFRRWVEDPERDPSLEVIAFRGDDVAAYVLNRLRTAPDGSIRGYLDEVGTVAAFRRLGLARALVARSLRLLRERGATSAFLGVDLQNPNQALTLYESCGFRVASAVQVYRRPFDGPWPEELT